MLQWSRRGINDRKDDEHPGRAKCSAAGGGGDVEGPVLVLAGPGSGKTRVLTHRVACLVREHGVPPRQIMAVTFTNKAAREMKDRLYRLLGDQLSELTIGTFHAICARILRREAQAAGISPQYVIYDTSDQLGLARQALRALNWTKSCIRPRRCSTGSRRPRTS